MQIRTLYTQSIASTLYVLMMPDLRVQHDVEAFCFLLGAHLHTDLDIGIRIPAS